MTSELLFLTILIKIAFFLKKKYGVKIQQIIKPCTSEYCKKKGHHLHDADCTLRVTGSHDAILAFANGDWDGMEDFVQPPVKVA